MREFLHRLVFLDETSVRTGLTRLRGRCPRGERLYGSTPFGRWHSQTFVAGLTCDELIAPWIIPGAMDSDAFDTYVETQLAPVLVPGTVVILDNLSTHRSPRAAASLRQQGCRFLFLPPYSPNLNPIEMAFGPAQGSPAALGGQKLRARPRSPRQHLQPVHPHRVRELLPSGRVCVRLNANRFSSEVGQALIISTLRAAVCNDLR